MNSSSTLFEQAQHYIPGGVNSPVRAFKEMGGDPIFFKQGKGAYLTAVSGETYIDYVGSWGPAILGHAHPVVVNAVQKAAENGLSFGAPTILETEMAAKICHLMPNIEQVRLVNSGTEATMSAIRLARGFTKRNKIIKFEGCYHGHVDSLLLQAGSGGLTFGMPSSLGVPESVVADTHSAIYNHLDSVAQIFETYGHEIAALIVEPVAGNMGCILPIKGFLEGLRELCTHYGALLIFDEVMTGFRVGLGGAQAHYGIHPDLTTLGKVIGGGLPIAAYGGRKEIMACLSPLGGVYQAGTLSGNPIAVSAGLANLEEVSKPGFYETLSDHTHTLIAGIKERSEQAGIPLVASGIGGLFGFFFTKEKHVFCLQEVKRVNKELFKAFFQMMLKEGIYFPPSAYEACFMSAAHGELELKRTLEAVEKVFNKLGNC